MAADAQDPGGGPGKGASQTPWIVPPDFAKKCLQAPRSLLVFLEVLQPVDVEDADVFQGAQLVIRDFSILVRLVHLQLGEPENVIRGPAMADHALRPARIMPGLLSAA